MAKGRKRMTFQTGNGDGVGFNRPSNSQRHREQNDFISDADRFDPHPGRRWKNLFHKIKVERVDNRWQEKCKNCKWVSQKSMTERDVQVSGFRHRFSDN
jgi:hypothetical protein